MKTEQLVVLGTGLLVVAFAAFWEASTGLPKRAGAEITPETLKQGTHLPRIWLFYNDADVNARHWTDFMARGSRAIQIPLLNLCYQTIIDKNGKDYQVEVIGGLTGVAEKLGGWDKLPAPMRNPRGQVTKPEEDWIRTAVLAKYGGLWLSPSVICLKGFGKLPNDKIVGFGQDEVPMYGSPAPGFRALWVPVPEHPMMKEWEARIRDRLENQTGGRQVRGDAKSEWQEFSTRNLGVCEVHVKEEGGRDARTNKKLELEDLLTAGSEGRLHFEISKDAVYIPIPYEDLLNRRYFGWILRSSESQIMASDIGIRWLFEKSKGA